MLRKRIKGNLIRQRQQSNRRRKMKSVGGLKTRREKLVEQGQGKNWRSDRHGNVELVNGSRKRRN